MTYCFAWKYQDAVLLIADALVTQTVPADADRPTTSMGEPHRQLSPTEFVQERQLKFRELREGIVVAVAGDGRLALKITDYMEDNITRFDKATDVFLMVEASFGPFDPARRVQMLLIQGKEDGECEITRWDTQGGCQDATTWGYIGSLAPQQAQTIADLFLRIVSNQKSSKEGVLLAGMAYVISLGQHEDLIAQHVGGVVYGLRVQRGKTIWPDDLIIVHHRDDISLSVGRISVHAREGSVFLQSTYHGTSGGLFVNKHERVRTDDIRNAWVKQWWPYLRVYFNEHFTTCTRWLFINRDRQVSLVFVNHGRPEQASNHLHFVRKEGNGLVPAIGDELREVLLRAATSGAPEVRIVDVVIPGEPLPDGIIRT